MPGVYTRRAIGKHRHIHFQCDPRDFDRLKELLAERNQDLSSFGRDLFKKALDDHERGRGQRPADRQKRKEPLRDVD